MQNENMHKHTNRLANEKSPYLLQPAKVEVPGTEQKNLFM